MLKINLIKCLLILIRNLKSLFLQSCAATGKNGYIEILDEYNRICDNDEKITIRVLESLNDYSNETGYIQNAKTLKEILHNTSVHLKTHVFDCLRATINGAKIIIEIAVLADDGNSVVMQGIGGISLAIDISNMRHNRMIDKNKHVNELHDMGVY